MPFAIEGKMCPLFTAAKIAASPPEALAPSSIVAPDGAKPPARKLESINCQGDRCGWFGKIANEKGEIIEGSCVIMNLNMNLVQMTNIGAALAQFSAQQFERTQEKPAKS